MWSVIVIIVMIVSTIFGIIAPKMQFFVIVIVSSMSPQAVGVRGYSALTLRDREALGTVFA